MRNSAILATAILTLVGGTYLQPTTFASPAATDYQATGPVVSIDDAKIVIQKGKEAWQINRSAATKVSGGTMEQIKPGAKVTVHYTMSATQVEIKPEKTGKAAPVVSGSTSAPKKKK